MLTPKENYLRMLEREIPEYVPSFYDPYSDHVAEEFLTPVSAPEGTYITSFGVEYIACESMNMGAMPNPNKILCPDITRWDQYIKKPDVSGRDWESYYKAQEKNWDRTNRALNVGGGDYWLTAVSFLGFEGTMLAMYEEPECLKAMLEYVSEFYIEVLKKQIYYTKPDILGLMDDDAAYQMPFFSLEMHREFFKPLQQMHIDIAHESGMFVTRHDCGKCEHLIPDWIEQDIRSWSPAQTSNDLKGIKAKYGNKIAIEGGWDNQGELGFPTVAIPRLKDALAEYVDTLAPGGGFVYMVMLNGAPTDPEVAERNAVIKDFYEDYVRNYYKNH